jgi:hypothetical protein
MVAMPERTGTVALRRKYAASRSARSSRPSQTTSDGSPRAPSPRREPHFGCPRRCRPQGRNAKPKNGMGASFRNQQSAICCSGLGEVNQHGRGEMVIAEKEK